MTKPPASPPHAPAVGRAPFGVIPDVLARIVADKRRHIARRRGIISIHALTEVAERRKPPRGFVDALEREVDAGRYGLIAEIKRASPSKGVIREPFDAEAIARAYQAAGATCLSILTDRPYFQGRDEYLTFIHHKSWTPLLRKDFIVDPYQVVESRALGADCILLIMACLSDDQARMLERLAMDHGMDVLVEVHDAEELDRALELETRLIGINNRNLKTLEVDLATTEALAAKIPDDHLIVAESGLYTRADLDRMNAVGASCFLVGESLMRQPDIGAAVRDLLGDKAPPLPTDPA